MNTSKNELKQQTTKTEQVIIPQTKSTPTPTSPTPIVADATSSTKSAKLTSPALFELPAAACAIDAAPSRSKNPLSIFEKGHEFIIEGKKIVLKSIVTDPKDIDLVLKGWKIKRQFARIITDSHGQISLKYPEVFQLGKQHLVNIINTAGDKVGSTSFQIIVRDGLKGSYEVLLQVTDENSRVSRLSTWYIKPGVFESKEEVLNHVFMSLLKADFSCVFSMPSSKLKATSDFPEEVIVAVIKTGETAVKVVAEPSLFAEFISFLATNGLCPLYFRPIAFICFFVRIYRRYGQ